MLHSLELKKLLSLCAIFLFGLLSASSGAQNRFPERRPTFASSAPKAAAAVGIVQAMAATAYDLAAAMDIPLSLVANATLGDSDPLGVHVFTYEFGGFPIQKNSFAAISSGQAAAASTPNMSESLSFMLSGQKNSQGNDLVHLTVTLTVPPGARFWSVDWKFLSEEFEEYVGSTYNDAFFIETPATDIVIVEDVASSQTNVALDPFGSRVSINTTGATGMTISNAAGTTYDGATDTITTVSAIPAGASQITIVFSVTDLGDSIYDSTVFLDNFQFLTEFVDPPRLNAPGIKALIPESPISHDKPTVIMTHSISAAADFGAAPDSLWMGNLEKQAAGLIKAETGGAANIIHFVWENAFSAGFAGTLSESTYNAAQPYVHDAGEYLAKELLKPEYLGPSYNGKIHFIGHALGSIVNGYGARAFLERATNINSAQFTALDRPDHVKTNIAGCIAFPGCRGYGRDFFAEVFREVQTKPGRNLNLVIDNYYSKGGGGLGDRTDGLNVYNHAELINPRDIGDTLFSEEGASNNSSGVQQWYRWTVDPNGLYPQTNVCSPQTGNLLTLPLSFHASLDPCNKGWKRSILRQDALNLATENRPSTTVRESVFFQQFKSNGCLLATSILGTPGITCSEPSSPSGITEIEIPQSANALSFKYRFTDTGDGDYVAIYLDNVLIWTFAGSSYLGTADAFLESGPIAIGDLTGERHMTVILYNVGEPNASFEITDLIALKDLSSVNLRVASGGAEVANTMESIGQIKTGYAGLTLNSGELPYGTAVLSFKQNGIIVSEAGIPASPPTTAARVFIDYRSNVPSLPGRGAAGNVNINTGIAIVNRGSAMANIVYTLRNIAGNTITTGHGTLTAGGYFACFIDQLKDVAAPDFNLPADFQNAYRFASLDVTSDQPLSVLALRGTNNQRNDFIFTTTPIADLTQAVSYNPQYFPHFADGGGYSTSLLLLNTSTNRTETGTLNILDDNGNPIVVSRAGGGIGSSFQYSIPAGGAFHFQTDGSPVDMKTGWIELVPSSFNPAPIGSAVLAYNPEDVLVSESGIPSAAATTHARVYVDLTNNHNVGLAIANITNSDASIAINAFQSDGLTPAGVSLPPIQLLSHGHAAAFADQFVSGLPAEFNGVLEISSTTPFAALTLRSLLNERHDFLMTTFPIADANKAAPSPVFFPLIADGGGYVTQFIILSGGGSSSVTLNFYDQNGQALAVSE